MGVPVTQAAEPKKARPLWGAAAFGAGFAVVFVILLVAFYWRIDRPKPWTDKAITAKPNELTMGLAGEEERMEFRYALTNNTRTEYSIPSPDSGGTLFRVLPEDSSLQKVSDATWDSGISIPPGQTINVVFTVCIKLSDFNSSAAALDQRESDAKFIEFTAKRLREIKSFEFLDYMSHYRIVLPSNWQKA
jgi:hypothetical protein